MSRFFRRWGIALALLTLVAVYATLQVVVGRGEGMLWAGVLLPAAYLFSPLLYPGRASRADALAAPDRVAIYVKPDIFCIRLRLALGGIAKKALWIDTIADPDAEAWVREVNGGDLLLPTVVIGAQLRRNPDPHWVGQHLLSPSDGAA